MCIPPDHMRNDLPTTVSPWQVYDLADVTEENKPCVYIGVTDDTGNTVTLPCFAVEFVEGKGIVLMAHRTGRPA